MDIFMYIFLCLLLINGITRSLESDVDCLRSFKASLEDPLNSISSTWNFNNASAVNGFICSFSGIDCWHPDENRVLNIKLAGMGLKGQFPLGISNCSSLTGLDLSHNNFSGSIPYDVSRIITYVTNLDLSSNQFSGQIPVNLANCTYLNEVRLDNNQFTGLIPPQIGQLNRIKEFSVANNQLNGPVPNFGNVSISVDSYANNKGLCGKPLPACKGPRKTQTGPIIGAAIAGVTVAVLGVSIGMFFYLRRTSRKQKEDDPEGNKWAKSIKGTKGIKISMFGKSVTKMRLNDLMKATNDFSKNNIIGSERTGTTYMAVLEDGTSLMVKRLQDIQHTEKEFVSEMSTLGIVKHNNLVPLLGFCVAKKERFLVYKHMPNGTLHDQIHPPNESDKKIDWQMRLKIGIGSAKGFAWLHHSCNPRIIHRNISSKCILLDAKFEPKISDFGLARLMNPIDTHLSTFVNGEFGEFGYVAPEYARTLVATPKGDVFSFGVVLLELVTGEKPTNVTTAPENLKGNMVDWILHLSSKSKLHDAIDKSLTGKGCDNELFQFLKVACSCVLPPPKERPTMYEVYQLLRAIGQRYNFTADDELLMVSETGDAADSFVELIVARETIS